MHKAETGGFRMLPSYYDAIRDLPDAERLALYDAICDFGFGNGDGAAETLPPMLAGYFLLLRPTLEKSVRFFERQKANGTKGGRKPKTAVGEKTAKTQTKPTAKRDSEGDSEGESDRESEGEGAGEGESKAPASPPAKRFTPPTLDQIEQYCAERGSGVDAGAFADYYAARGWRVGGGTMKDWRAAVRTWERRETTHADTDRGAGARPPRSAGRDFGIRYDNDPLADADRADEP